MVFCRPFAYNMLMDKKITLWPLRKPKRSLASEMWLVILTALMIFGIAFVIALLVLSRESRKDSEVREAETLIASVAGNLRSGIDSYKDISRLVMLNEKVTTFLNAKYVDRGIINDARFGILDVLNVSTNLDSVFIFRNVTSDGCDLEDLEFSSCYRNGFFVIIEIAKSQCSCSVRLECRIDNRLFPSVLNRRSFFAFSKYRSRYSESRSEYG